MPEYTDNAKVPIPLRSETDDLSAILKGAFTAVDSLYVLRARNTADRDARYADVLAGTVVTGTEQDAMWRKRLDGTWATIWCDIIAESGIVSPGPTSSKGGWTVDRQWARRVGSWVDLYVRVIWNGRDVIKADSGGDIDDIAAFTIQSLWRPKFTQDGMFTYGGGTDPAGEINYFSGFGSCYISQSSNAAVLRTIIPGTGIGAVQGRCEFSFSYTVAD